MSKSFYANLAATNIKKNTKIYLPYVLMNIYIIAMFYIMHSIANDPGLETMSGGSSLKPILWFGVIIIGFFSTLTVFYTNSFIMKRRKKEVGVYNILGLGKRHIARMMSLETLMIAIGCLSVGLITGIVFSKLMYLFFLKMLGFPISFTLSVSANSVTTTFLLFSVIFFLTMVLNLAQIHLANPIELVRGSAVGEREPKTKWLMTLIGILTLGSGYVIAIMVKSPLEAVYLFFVAVILVMIGTYALFTTGSIVLLKALRSNKSFYYQMNNFTVVSGMLYRMKQNAAGLANICILSTMVIISLTTTISMYAGLEDMLINRFPSEASVSIKAADDHVLNEVEAVLEKTADAQGIEIQNKIINRFGLIFANREDNKFTAMDEQFYVADTHVIQLFTWETYLEMAGESAGSEVPEAGEALLFSNIDSFNPEEIVVGDRRIQIKQTLNQFGKDSNSLDDLFGMVNLVVKDESEIKAIYETATQKAFEGFNAAIAFDLTGTENQKAAFERTANKTFQGMSEDLFLDGRAISKESFCMIYGGFLFLGLFLGALFLVATVLIMYYKQISEGYDDQQRYETMQKVGMSHLEIKSAIKRQTVLVFFLPLVTAVIHVAFAFNVVNRLLAVFNFTNTPLFIGCTALTVLIFGIFYYGIYRLTVRAYFKIVSWNA